MINNELPPNTPLEMNTGKLSKDDVPKLSPQTCTNRATPTCPYCGCKNNNALNFFTGRKTSLDLNLTCTCCKKPFKFDREVAITYTSRPLNGWKTT